MAKCLRDLLKLMSSPEVVGSADIEILDIVHDSREVKKGSLFVCVPGVHVDGHDFVQTAAESGAVCILVQRDIPAIEGITVVKVSDTHLAMQQITPCFFDYPSRKMRMIGVTGTNGKTTTTHLIRSILIKAGFKVGLIGTIHTMIGDDVFPIKNTTPDVVYLQKILAIMREKGIEYVVMEVSSHALALNRIAGCEFDAGIFTNLTQDHLDFHGNLADYLAAKAKLFELISSPSSKKNKFAIINIDDEAATTIIAKCRCPVFTYGVNKQANVGATDIHIEAKKSNYAVITNQGIIYLQLRITGIFNVYNVLAAIATALAEQISPAVIQMALEEFISVPGRFELVEAGQPFTVIVDYAHTPDGLENVLKTAREFVEGRLITVFGCGGDRDNTKRPIMGGLAVKYADVVIATSDNPRSEDPETILNQVEAGIIKAMRDGVTYEKIVDRRAAIQHAVEIANPTDVILIAGKGHETYQILKDKTIDFDDRQVTREIILEMRK